MNSLNLIDKLWLFIFITCTSYSKNLCSWVRWLNFSLLHFSIFFIFEEIKLNNVNNAKLRWMEWKMNFDKNRNHKIYDGLALKNTNITYCSVDFIQTYFPGKQIIWSHEYITFHLNTCDSILSLNLFGIICIIH